jgi:hypothetical protein
MQAPVWIFLPDNIQLSEKIFLIIAMRTAISRMRVSKPDLLLDPPPGLGLRAPDEDCLLVFAWIGCQSCGEKKPHDPDSR